jgi:hypothetical protein
MKRSQFELHALIEDEHWWFVARRRIVTRLLGEAVPPSPDRTVLEIGLGAGGNLRALTGSYRCVGYDLSGDALRTGHGDSGHRGVSLVAMLRRQGDGSAS